MTHFRFLSICKDARACVRNSSAFRNVRIDYEYRIGLSLSIIRLQPKMRVQSIRIYLASLEMDIARALLSAFGQHLTAFHLQRMNMKFGVPEFIKAGALTHECQRMRILSDKTKTEMSETTDSKKTAKEAEIKDNIRDEFSEITTF